MTGEEKLKAALAETQQRERAEDEQKREQKAQRARERQRQAEAEAKFPEIRVLASQAVERLKLLLKQHQLSVTQPVVHSSGAVFDRASFTVMKQGRIVAHLAVLGWTNGNITIEGVEGTYSFDDPTLTVDLFYDKFAGIIADRLSP